MCPLKYRKRKKKIATVSRLKQKRKKGKRKAKEKREERERRKRKEKTNREEGGEVPRAYRTEPVERLMQLSSLRVYQEENKNK